MSVSGAALEGFVPALLARRLDVRPEPPESWLSEPCELVALGVDISESTSMTQDLVSRSPDGPENVAAALNAVFTVVADVITAHGGSVVSLAGDEIVAVWPAGAVGGRETACYWAASAALAIREEARLLGPVGGYPIRMRAGIGAGRASLLDIGRDHGRRLFVVGGPAMQEMAHAQKHVAPSEIGVGDTAWSLLDERVRAYKGSGFPPVGVLTAMEPLSLPRPQPPTPGKPLSPAVTGRYVPACVFERLRASDGGLNAELSPITVLFCTFRTGPWQDDTPAVVSEASLQALDIIGTYEGTVVSVRQDLDGLTLVVGFGLPPMVRERQAARANLAGLEISSAMKEFVEHGIGVATGHAFCGVFGSPAYRQYTMIGPVVNLAARLMQSAQNEVLCDQVSQHLSRDRLRFSARGLIEVKGFREPVPVYRAEWHETDPGLSALRRLSAESKEVVTRGREREREELAGRLVALSLGTSTAVVIEGEPGVGKTHLAVDLLQASEGYGRILVGVGGGDEMEPRPYHAWRRVLAKALGLAAVRDPTERERQLRERLSKWPSMEQWAPLVNEVFDLSLDDSPVRDMTGTARRENTIRLLVQLLADATSGAPLLVVLDDCQWMDSASWELVRAVHRGVKPVMMVLLTRPLPASRPADTPPAVPAGTGPQVADDGAIHTINDVREYLREQGALFLQLKSLSPAVTEQIARDFLGADLLEESLRGLFREKVQGSPLFTVELAFQLRTDNVISVVESAEGVRGRLTVPPTELERLRLPVRVEEVFRARLSALSERQRALIRAASVVGATFDDERLLAADPQLDPGALADDLRALERSKVIEAHPDGWRFAHNLIRDVARQSALPSELRQRHRALAEWYEAHRLEPDTYAILAHHLAAAGELERELEYLEAAAASALSKGAEDEAIALLEQALAVNEELGGALPAVPDARRAFWYSQLGEAFARQNRLDEAILRFRTALGLLGRRLPERRAGWLARLVWELLKQVLHLVPAVTAWGLRRRDRERLSQSSWVSSMLAEAHYFKGDALAWTATNLAAVNLAERAGDVGLAGRAYSGLANLAGALRLHSLARRYFRRSRREITGQAHGTHNPLTLEVFPDLAWEHDVRATLSEAVYLRTMNRTVNVMPMLDGVVQQYRRMGLNQPLEIALAVRGFFHAVDGTLRSARVDFEELLTSARWRGNRDHLVWALTMLVPTLLHLDRRAEALSLDEEAVRVFNDADRLFAPNFHGSHVQALAVRGRAEEALSHARQAMRQLGPVPVWIHLVGLTALTEGCLELLRKELGTPSEKAIRKVSRQALRVLGWYTRVYPFSRARRELLRGLYDAELSNDRAARRHWKRGLRIADDAGLLLDSARIHVLLAEGLPEDDAERAEHLRRARRTLEELGLGNQFEPSAGLAA